MCECDQEYGPCEQHSTALVIRDGGARNPDEYIMRLIDDLADVGAEVSSTSLEEYLRLTDSLEPNGFGGLIFPDGDDYEAAVWLSEQLESTLAENICVFHEDGYVIVMIHDDCPLLEG